MNGDLLRAALRLSRVKRWKGVFCLFPENVKHHSFHVPILAAALSERTNVCYPDQFGRPLDLGKVALRALLHDIDELQDGNMPWGTKRDPRISPLMQAAERRWKEQYATLASESIRPDIWDAIVNAEDDTPEGIVVRTADTLDALLKARRETLHGNVVFGPIYEQLRERLADCQLKAALDLIADLEADGTWSRFHITMMGLDQVHRWPKQAPAIPEDDREHSYDVACLAAYMALRENRKFGGNLDLFRVIGSGLLHDAAEVRMGDLPSDIKHGDPQLAEAFAALESRLAIEMLQWLPPEIERLFRPLMLEPKAGPEGALIAAADKLSAVIKCRAEIDAGRRTEFEEIYWNALRTVQRNYPQKCVEDFLAYALHDLLQPDSP